MSPPILRGMVAALIGIAFAFGEVLIFDGGRWQQPLGFVLVALSMANVVGFIINIPVVLHRLLTTGRSNTRSNA